MQNVLDVDPSFAPARVALSKIWLRKGDLSKANEYATLAVRIDEDFRPWWEKLNEIRAGIQNGQNIFSKVILIKHLMSMKQYLKNIHIIHRPITIWA